MDDKTPERDVDSNVTPAAETIKPKGIEGFAEPVNEDAQHLEDAHRKIAEFGGSVAGHNVNANNITGENITLNNSQAAASSTEPTSTPSTDASKKPSWLKNLFGFMSSSFSEKQQETEEFKQKNIINNTQKGE